VILLVARGRARRYSLGLSIFLGYGVNKISIVSSALLASISLFYIYSVGSYLQHVIVYYFLLRVTYIKPFNEYLLTRYFDSVIITSLTFFWLFLSLGGKARIFVPSVFGIFLVVGVVARQDGLMTILELVSLPLIVFCLLGQMSYRKRVKKRKHNQLVQYLSPGLTLNYLCTIATVLAVYSTLISLSVISTTQHIPVDKIFETRAIPIDNYGYEIFVLFSVLSPVLLILIFFCLPVKLLVKSVLHRIGRRRIWQAQSDTLKHQEDSHRLKHRLIIISILVLTSISLAIIPQLPTVNTDNQKIGSDSDDYIEWINQLKQAKNLEDFLIIALSQSGLQGDRPLSLIFLFFLTSLTDAPALDTIEYLPIILGPALVLVIYFLTRELTANETASLFAASLTALGYFQVSMGIYAGFYANWIALLLGYSSLIFFFRFLRKSSSISPLIFFILLLTALFSHALTWSVISIVMGIFLVVSLLRNTYPRNRVILLLILIMSTVAVDVAKTLLLGPIGSAGGVELTLSLAQAKIELKELGFVWNILVDATQEHFGGIFCNFIILGLVIYWSIRSNLSADYNTFIVIFLMIGIPSLFFGDWIVQSRVFYNIPFQIPAAIALTYLSAQKYALKLISPIFVWLVAISLWTVSNFYEVLPS
jgi:hypothetical protein